MLDFPQLLHSSVQFLFLTDPFDNLTAATSQVSLSDETGAIPAQGHQKFHAGL